MAKSPEHDWVEGVPVAEVREMIARTFAFLVSDYSFREPVDRSINTMVISLSYSGKRLAIEPLVDRKDRFVETCIVRLVNGSRPEGWKIDENRDQFMTGLFEARSERKVERVKRDRSPGSPQEALQILLDAEVALLREGFPDFLADEDRYFTDLNRVVSRNSVTTECAELQSVGKGVIGAVSDRASAFLDGQTPSVNVMKLMVALAG